EIAVIKRPPSEHIRDRFARRTAPHPPGEALGLFRREFRFRVCDQVSAIHAQRLTEQHMRIERINLLASLLQRLADRHLTLRRRSSRSLSAGFPLGISGSKLISAACRSSSCSRSYSPR